jgi:hypothetical protein
MRLAGLEAKRLEGEKQPWRTRLDERIILKLN